MWHAYGNANIHADCDCDGHIHSDSDCDGNCHVHANGDSDIYGYGDSDSNCYRHGDSNCDRIAAAYTDAPATADAAAPTVRPAGCSLAWELASEPREFPRWPQSICSTRATVHRKVPRFPGSDWTWLRFRRRRQCNA